MRWSSVLDVLFPPACVECGAAGSALCPACRPPPEAVQRFTVGALRSVALGPYEGPLRRAVLAMKSGRRDVAETLGALLGALLGSPAGDGRSRADALVPVPTTRRRRSERGFDQAALLARGAALSHDLPVAAALRHVAGGAQHGRSRAERLAASGRFAFESASLSAGARVLLVDDVTTTGATLRDCAATLWRARVVVAGAIVVARAVESHT
jgi:ComF family protein